MKTNSLVAFTFCGSDSFWQYYSSAELCFDLVFRMCYFAILFEHCLGMCVCEFCSRNCLIRSVDTVWKLTINYQEREKEIAFKLK